MARPLTRELAVAITIFLLALSIGSMIGQGHTSLAVLAVGGLLSAFFSILYPFSVACVIYPTLYLIPYDLLRIPSPLFSSPIETFVLVFISLSFLSLIIKRRSLPLRSSVILLIFISGLVVVSVVLIKQWPSHEIFLFMGGMWSMFIPLFGITTPRQASVFLMSIYIPISIKVLQFVFLLLTSGFDQALLREFFLQAGGTLQMAVAAMWLLNVVLSIILFGQPSTFAQIVLSLVACAGVILVILGGFASAVIMLFIDILFYLLFLFILTRISPEVRSKLKLSRLLVAFFSLLMLGMLVMQTPSGARTLNRIMNYREDPSAASRISVIENSIESFKSSPITGVDNYYTVDRHNSYFTWAGRYGLLLLVPMGLALFFALRTFIHPVTYAQRPLDRALAMGMAAAFCAYIVGGFLTPVQGDFGMDSIAWVNVGLAIVWSDWLKNESTARLVI